MSRIGHPDWEEEQTYLPLVEPVRFPGQAEPVPVGPGDPGPGSIPEERPEEVPA